MKILVLSAYAYYKGQKGFEKNNSGFAYAVSDTCDALSNAGDEVFLLTQSGFTNGFIQNETNVVKKRWIDIITTFHFADLINGIQASENTKGCITLKLKVLLYYLNKGYTDKVIKAIKPDSIHIQSISDYTIPFMLSAIKAGVPFIVSNHGLATFLSDVDPRMKRIEQDFFKFAEKSNTIVTTVSSGIKRRIVEYYGLKGNNIYVVPNGYKPSQNELKSRNLNTIKTKLHIAESDFVFICVGSISRRKNQIQVVKAFHLLLEKNYHNIKLLFAGDGPEINELKEYVENSNLSTQVLILGNVEHEKMPIYYSLSNCTIMASIDEGFGLPVIEGYFYGIPSVLYGDLDAANDICFSDATIVVNERGVIELSEGMKEALKRTWDCKKIQTLAQQFTAKEMGMRYHRVLEMGIEQKSSISMDCVKRLITGRE